MEENTGVEVVKEKTDKRQRSSVVVKEVDADDASVEEISISNSLAEILIQDPFYGRSDYSDLPGVRTGISSSWRSFAEYPRRTNTFTRYPANTSTNSEQREQKNYEARIRREKLTLQRQAKRERLKAQQRERRRQQTFLSELQNQSSSVCNNLNPGVIISSPQKGSPKKLSRRDNSEEGHVQRKVKYGGNGQTSHGNDESQKSHNNSKDKVNYDVSNFKEGDDDDCTGEYFDDVVSTTSAHHGDVGTSNSPKTSLISTISSASQGKNIFDSLKDSDDNPVTSSSQDAPETLSLKPISSDASKPSLRVTCIVTSTTAPEIAVADSSTTSGPRRKTRNMKRVDYTEMLENDSDHDTEQHVFRESVNSGRKIRPVKRTLEKAIVDASLKKSPRKKKTDADKKGNNSSSQPLPASSSNTETEDDKIRQICDTIKQMKNAANKLSANTAHVAGKKNNAGSKHKHKQCLPSAVSTDVPSQGSPVSTTANFQPHSVCQSSTSDVPLPVHSAFVSGSLAYKQQNPSSQFVTSVAQNVPLNFPLVFSYQQPYTAPLGHIATIPPSSVIPSHSLQNSAIAGFNSVMQPQFQKPSALVTVQNANSYPVNSLQLPQASLQMHTPQTLLTGIPAFSKDTVVYDMNHSIQPPDILLQPQTFISAQNNSVSAYQPVIRQVTTSSRVMQLNDSSSRASVAYQHPSTIHLKLNSSASVDQQSLRAQNMMTSNSLTECSASPKYINSNSSLTTTHNRTYSQGTEVLSCKKQSQFDVESLLSSAQKSKKKVKNSDNSNNESSRNQRHSSEIRCNQNVKNSNNEHTSAQNTVVAPRLTSQEMPGLIPKLTEVQNQSQYVTFSLISQSSSPQGHSSSGQRAFLQTSNQSLEKSHVTPIGPPPLILLSDSLNSSVNVSSFDMNQGNSASLTYQTNSPLTAPQTKHNISSRHTLPSASQSILEKTSITDATAAQIESSMQRSVMTAKSSSTAYYKVASSHQQGMQLQLSHPSLQYPDAFLLSHKVKPAQPFSGSQQDQLLRMPALMSFINNPHPAEVTKGSCQRSKAPAPHFTGKPTGDSNMSQQNLISKQRAPTGMTISRKPQVPISQEGRNPPDEAMSNFLARYRFPPPRLTSKPGGTPVQHYNTQNQNTMVPNPRVPAPNTEIITLRVTQAQDQWRRPPLRQDPAQSRRSNSAAGKHCQDQMLQQTSLADGSQNHTNPQSIQSRTFQQSSVYHPKSSDNAKGTTHQFSTPEDQRTLQRLSSGMSAKMLQNSNVTLPNRTSSAQIQNTNFSSSPQYTVQTGKLGVSTSQLACETSSGSSTNTAMYALDLSQKTSGSGHKPVTMVVTSCVNPSITATSRFIQQKPVTMVVTSCVNSSITATSRFIQQKPVTMVVTSCVNPSITSTSSFLQQNPVTVRVTSSVNPSVTATSRLQQKPVSLVVTSSVNPSVTATSILQPQNQVTMFVNSSVNPPVTTVSNLTYGHSAAKPNQATQESCDYPLTQSQIKQESMSQHDQSDNDSRHILQPDFRKSQMPDVAEERPKAITSSLPALLSYQNPQPGREFSNLQVSHSISNPSTAVNASPMPLPALVSNQRKESAGELIKVKVEAHISHVENSENVDSTHATKYAYSMPLSQSTLYTRAPQIPVSASVTSGTDEPQWSTQAGVSRPSSTQAHETTATFHAVRSSHANGQHSIPSHKPAAMKDALPAHIRIKQEILAETTQNLTSMSSSSMPSTLYPLMPPSVASVAQNNNTSDLVKKSLAVSSDSVSSLTAVSSESLPPRQRYQSTTSTADLILSAMAGNINQHPLTSTESKLSSHTVKPTSDSQPFIPKVASHTQYVNDSVNSTYGMHINSPPTHQNQTPHTVIKVENSSVVNSSSRSTSESSSTRTSIQECLATMSQTMLPVCTSAITTEAAMSFAGQMPSSSLVSNCDTYPHEAPAKTQIAVVIPPLPSATSNKQPIIKASPSKLNPVLNDPLFAWHTDSNKQMSSFSMEDITNSSLQECEQNLPRLCSDMSMTNNNYYTITVSYPCTDNSDLHCDTEAPSVDPSVVKVEPSVETFLNPREVIDLCLSDSEDNDLIDTEASSSCRQTICPNSVSSLSHLTYSSSSKDALENKTALLVMESKDKHLSTDNLQRTPVKDYSLASDQHNSMSSMEKHSTVFSGISPFPVKQLIKSPLTGENVSVSGEHMTFIQRRLARISSDIMSITSDVSESETSAPSTKNLSRTPPLIVIDRVLCDSVSPVCEPGQLPLHTSVTGAEIQPATSRTSTGTSKTRKRLFNTLQVNTNRVFSTRNQTRGVEVKKEYIETISIDDDSSDDGSQQYPPSTSSEVNLSEVCSPSPSFLDASSALFPMPFGSSLSVLSPQKDLSSLSGSEPLLLSPSHGDGSRLASIANWTNEEVSEWLKHHKLEKVCPNLKNLDGRGLQRMAFEHRRDPDMFYNRVKKTLGLTFFQTMVICRSMKELNDSGLYE